MSIAPPAAPPACGAQNLTKVFGEGGPRPVVAVNNVNLAIEAGSFTAIMGPSGSGKSTLMHCMAGLDRVTSGSVWVGDQDLSRLSERQVTRIRRDRIGFVFQSFNLLPTLTAEQNILLPLELAGRKPDRVRFRSRASWAGYPGASSSDSRIRDRVASAIARPSRFITSTREARVSMQ